MRPSSHAFIIAGILIAVSRFVFTAEAGNPERVKHQTPSQALSRDAVLRALRQAAEFYWKRVSTEGGYHFYYAEDLSYGRSEHGDGLTQVEVQREATPIVGLAYLRAYEATGDRFYLEAARAAAHALVKGQLCSGGWSYLIEFDPAKRPQYRYRSDRTCGAANEEGPPTTLDDNVTQGALRLLMRVDLALDFADKPIHEALGYALDRLSKAQYPNGAWPQRYRAFPDPAKFPVRKASYPADWPRKWPGENYQLFYTFNDNTISDTIDLFLEAARVYNEPRYKAVAEKGGGFILLAQMPEPQPAWAQQYDLDMHPAWARIFEPPSVTGGESQGILKTLLVLYRETGDHKYLEPIPRSLAYLRRSILPAPISGVARPSEARARLPRGAPVLARFYELKTNKPLYITKGTRVTVPGKPVTLRGGYELSYSDESVIRHYGVLTSGAGLDEIAAEYQRLEKADPVAIKRPLKLRGLSPWSADDNDDANPSTSNLVSRASRIINQMDARGAWVEEGSIGKSGQVVSVFAAREMVVKIGDRILPLKENETLEVFEGADRPRERIVRSATFARNVETLCAWLLATKP
jgi:hypothetical protein